MGERSGIWLLDLLCIDPTSKWNFQVSGWLFESEFRREGWIRFKRQRK